MVTSRRKLGALTFGVFYGGSLVNGFDRGLAHVSRIAGRQGLSFDQWPRGMTGRQAGRLAHATHGRGF